MTREEIQEIVTKAVAETMDLTEAIDKITEGQRKYDESDLKTAWEDGNGYGTTWSDFISDY